MKEISENQQIEFLNFAHNEKRKVNFDYLNELKNSTIGELIKNMNISSKYTLMKRKSRYNLHRLRYPLLVRDTIPSSLNIMH